MISNWRNELREVVDEIESKAAKKVKETKGISNKVIINPKLGEAVEEIGGELIEMKEVDGGEEKKDNKDDAQVKQKERQGQQMKKRVLLAKLRAVRSGGGADIMASYQPEIEHSKLGDAKKKKDKERESKLPPHLQGDALGKMKKAFASEAVKGEDREMRKMAAQDRASGKEKRLTPEQGRKSVKPVYYRGKYTKEETINEVVMKFVKSMVKKKKTEKKPEKAMDAGARARRKLQQKDHEKVNFLPMDEAKIERGYSDYGKASIRNKRKFGTSGEMPDIMTGKKITKDATRGELIDKRRAEHKAKRGVKVNEEDKAFNFVLDKIKKEVGKGGYISKNNPRKPQSAADKAKARAHQAKVDAENAAARAKDPSQGRYPKG